MYLPLWLSLWGVLGTGDLQLAVAAHARDPDGLAAGLTVLLDGGLASGVLDADLQTADAAQAAARALVDADCPT